jgi:hypothetical protein
VKSDDDGEFRDTCAAIVAIALVVGGIALLVWLTGCLK